MHLLDGAELQQQEKHRPSTQGPERAHLSFHSNDVHRREAKLKPQLTPSPPGALVQQNQNTL